MITYVPPVHGAARTRRAVEREVRRQGHEIIGHTDSRAEAQAALAAGVADIIAGRPEHLLELAPWALGVTNRTAAVRSTAAALPVWAATQARQHPGRAAAICAALAGLAVAVALVGPDQSHPRRPVLLPPPSPSVPAPSRVPPTSPAPQRPQPPAPPSAPTARRSGPTLDGTVARQLPASPAKPSAPAQPPTTAPAHPPTAPPRTPPTTPPASPATPPVNCLITLDTPILDLRLCLDRLSS